MNCLQSVTGSSGRATQCASGSTTDALDDEDEFGGDCSRPARYIGAPLIMEAASKVDKCLARLQSLQGTVTVPKAPLSSSASASTVSPIFSRSRSCLHGSPKVHDNDKIRIHDVLRWSDDFSGKFKQERRDKYMRRLSLSKTEVFDDKKNPLDPHGEWKHWSSPAGDVHKVISEILMASQIAKQITGMVNAAIIQSDNSSDEGKRRRRDTATSPNPMTNPTLQQRNRKGDPLHKFRVILSTDGPAKKRSNAVGSRKEVLYPKSKQPIPDRACRPIDENQVALSTAKKMQSRRSPRAPVKETRPQEDMWSAKDITNSKSQQPQPELRAAKDATNSSKAHQQPQAELRARRDDGNSQHPSIANVSNSKPNPSQAESWAANDVTNSKSHQTMGRARATQEILHGKSHRVQADNWAAKDVTNRKSQPRAAPWPQSKKLVPANQLEAPYTLRRVRSSKSPPRTLVEKPRLSSASNKAVKPSFVVKQGSRGPQHRRMDPTRLATSCPSAKPESSSCKINQPLPDDTVVLASRANVSAADAKVQSPAECPPSSTALSEVKRCSSNPTALPKVFSSRPKGSFGSGDIKEIIAISAASPEIKISDESQKEFIDPSLDGFNIIRSTAPDSRTCSHASSPQKTPVKDSHPMPARSNPLLGSLRHKFIMEATEIRGPNRTWLLNRSKSGMAVLFSNPAFAPASPNGARPASETRQRPVAATTPPKSPPRSTSATRKVMNRIGRALSAGRRSISPEITRRLTSTRQKLSYLSPGKSLPSLISRLPSRGKRKPSPVPRPSIIRSTSCTRPAPASGELPLPPGRKALHHNLPAAHQNLPTTDQPCQKASPGAASTDTSSYFSLRMLKDLNCNAQQLPVKSSSRGTTPDIAPRISFAKSNGKAIRSHSGLDWEKEVGAAGVLSSCRKWVEESAPPAPGGVLKYEKENVEPPTTQRILIKENVVATGWDDEAVTPAVLSTSRSRKTEDISALSAAGSSYAPPGEFGRSFSGVRRSFSTGRIRTGTSFLRRARDWIRTQTPNRTRTHSPNWDQPRQAGLVI